MRISRTDAEARELEADLMHFKELLDFTIEKHEQELKEHAERVKQMGERREDEDGQLECPSGALARWSREQKKLNSATKRHEEVERELRTWVAEAEKLLKMNQAEREIMVKEFRRAQELE